MMVFRLMLFYLRSALLQLWMFTLPRLRFVMLLCLFAAVCLLSPTKLLIPLVFASCALIYFARP